MSRRELIAQELDGLSDQDLDRVLGFLHRIKKARAEAAVPMPAAESALAKDWLTAEEDEAWADLSAVDAATFAKFQELQDHPLPATDKLRRLLKTRAPWEK